ncbi:MAG: oligosaccharide repeat unit polymerase [Gemmatimonadetes bacterium]|nr:oligosaccharide repeat unit polymerase [Gemmatimonadota bacterium]
MSQVVRGMVAANLLLASAAASAFGSLGLGVTVAMVAFLAAAMLPVGGSRDRMISLESFALVGIAGYTLPVPLHHLAYRDYQPEIVQYAFELSMLGAAGLVLGNLAFVLLRRGEAAPAAPASVSAAEWRRYYWAGWAVFVVGVVSALLAVGLTVGFSTYVNAGYAGRSLLKRGAGPIELGLYHAVLGLVFVNLARLRSPELRRRRVVGLVLLLISLAFVAYVSFLGIRRPSFFLVLSMVLVYGAAGHGFRKARLALVGLPALLLFSIFANFRQVLSDQGAGAALLYVRNNFSLRWFDLSRSELGAPFRVLTDVLSTWGGDRPRAGITFMEAVPYALPRSAGLGVTSLSQEYTQRNFSSDYIAIGGNMGFNPVAEGYVNFGIAGVVLYFLVIGWFVSRIQFNAARRCSPADLMAYAVAAPWFIFFIRLDLASFTKVFLYSIVVPYLAAMALLLVWRSARARPSPRPPAWRPARAVETT